MSVFILGGAQSDFARHLQREGRELGELVGELVDAALADARVAPAEVDAIHIGNAFAPLFVGQSHLGALPATVRPALSGVPGSAHEAACASGSVAILAAMAELEAGRAGIALVLGVEQERNVTGEVAARHMGAAAWAGHEHQGARYLWPHAFSRIADEYDARWGLDRKHLWAIAEKAYRSARANPHAQTRGWTLPADPDDLRANPPVEGRLRRLDCAQVTDGGAALVLARADVAASWAARQGAQLERTPRIAGWGHRTATLALEPKLTESRARGGLIAPHVARAADEARARAGVPLSAVSGFEVHDCFTITEYLALDHLGITAPGEAWRAIEDGRTERAGATPINPSGGLIGGGHPVGATGVRMALDAALQVSGRAGAVEVPGARVFQTLNIGGSLATAISLVITAV